MLPENYPRRNTPSSLCSFFLLTLSLLFSGINSDELQILLKLKQSLQTPNNNNVFNSWDDQKKIPVCNFTGITCDSNGLVKEIELSSKSLTGEIPVDSICQLQSLEKLSLGFNNLHGLIKDELNNCVKLQYLDLGNNFFSGSFPDISSLNELRFLYVNNTGISGEFPWRSFKNMTENLVALSVGDNSFAPTPFPVEVFDLKKLRVLYLSNCSLNGQIDQRIGNLTELENLELADNSFSGKIPTEIGKLKKLWQLELYSNKFTGELPVGLRNLTGLKNFDASMNFLHGDLSELRFLTNLVSLQLFENELEGEIPAEFGGFKWLVDFSLYTNKLTGPLPAELGSWSEFNFIDVSENYLTGSIPPDMCKKGTMKKLLILQNRFTGAIPATYGNCSTLLRFRVSNNSLSGIIPPGIWGLPNLNIIDISMNQIEGTISSDIKNAKSLSQLVASNNRLSGELPEEISEAKGLVKIEINENRFSGKIPASIGRLKALNSLKLQTNMFSGDIPTTIGSCDSLSDINLARNSLSGRIPNSLGSLQTLNSLNLSNNEISGEIPESLSFLRLSLLDLSNNRLSGRIPKSLSTEAYNGSFTGNNGLCSLTVSSFSRCSTKPNVSKDVRTLILCFGLGIVILLLSITGFLHYKKHKKHQQDQKNQDRSLKEESWDVKSFHVLTFTEGEILDSIKEDNLIGKGGSGNVYRVSLSNGKELAVKHIWNIDSNGRKTGRSSSSSPILGKYRERSKSTSKSKSKEFDAEVETLSSIRHVNVVKLFCSITSEDSNMLVYEYMPNGSLWDKLHSSKKMELDWETRYEIAVGAAKGLEYLHHGCVKCVFHRDVKSSNILLDEFLKPRIADFGLAKIVQADYGTDSTHVIPGTHGYIAPEYGYTYKVDEKSDVYSFGVVLMELVSGKKPIETEYGDNKDIVSWVSNNLKSRECVLSIVDSRLPEVYKEEAIKILRIAILCTSRLPNLRPTMRSVVQMLEEAEPCKLVGIVVRKDENGVKKEVIGLEKS